MNEPLLSHWQYMTLLMLLRDFDEAKWSGKYSGSSEQADVGSVFGQVKSALIRDYPSLRSNIELKAPVE